MARFYLPLCAMAVGLVLAGCATPLDGRRDTELQSHAPAAARPTARPTRSFSSLMNSII